jgi:protein gp37
MPPPLTPFFVFCSSLADVFDNAVPAEWRRDLFKLIQATPHLTWLLLTKRPQNIVKLAYDALSCAEESPVHLPFVRMAWPRNAAIGCTVVTQEEADRDVPHLLRAKAEIDPAFAFLSMEPLLGAVDISKWLPGGYECSTECGWRSAAPPPWEACTTCGAQSLSFGEFCTCGAAEFEHICPNCDGRTVHEHPDTPCVDWVITGGETDQGAHKARPTHPKWLRDIRDQCAAAGVPYHHKQNGEWSRAPKGATFSTTTHTFEDKTIVFRVGKKHAGRTLYGVTHDARPAVRE